MFSGIGGWTAARCASSSSEGTVLSRFNGSRRFVGIRMRKRVFGAH